MAKIIHTPDLKLTYRAHTLHTNYAGGIHDFKKHHGLPASLRITEMVNTPGFDRAVITVGGNTLIVALAED